MVEVEVVAEVQEAEEEAAVVLFAIINGYAATGVNVIVFKQEYAIIIQPNASQ